MIQKLRKIILENHGENILHLAGDSFPIIPLRQMGLDMDYVDFDWHRLQSIEKERDKATDPFVRAMRCQLANKDTLGTITGKNHYDMILFHEHGLVPGTKDTMELQDISRMDAWINLFFDILQPGGTLLLEYSDNTLDPINNLLVNNKLYGIITTSLGKKQIILARKPLESALDDNKQNYYRHQNEIMSQVWSTNGSMCWGYFPEGQEKTLSLEAATDLHIERLAQQIHPTPHSVLLDVGCGNGYTAIWLAQRYQCHVVGVDLSTTNIKHAQNLLAQQPDSLQKKVSFVCVSMMDAQFEPCHFSHIWSNAALYHVHAADMLALFQQFNRFLQADGVILFDTLISPNGDVDTHVREWVCDRFHLETLHTRETYFNAMQQSGIVVKRWEDITQHLRTTYERVSENAQNMEYPRLAKAYRESAKTTERGTLGWILVEARKKGSS